jgi:hypothetical protein
MTKCSKYSVRGVKLKMEIFACVLTDKEVKKLQDLKDFYGEENREILMKLALVKFHRQLFAEDREEHGLDQDLEELRIEETKILGE